MCRARYLVQLDRSRAVGQNPFYGYAFHDGRLPCFRQCVGCNRELSLPEVLIERYVAGVGDHGKSLGESGADSSRVIEVMMCVHHCADRLRRPELTHFPYDGERAIVALWRFDQENVVPHLDGDAVMRSADYIPNSGSDRIYRDVYRLCL